MDAVGGRDPSLLTNIGNKIPASMSACLPETFCLQTEEVLLPAILGRLAIKNMNTAERIKMDQETYPDAIRHQAERMAEKADEVTERLGEKAEGAAPSEVGEKVRLRMEEGIGSGTGLLRRV
eukprot:1148670-Pelagomonas_calceolata.AAC.2